MSGSDKNSRERALAELKKQIALQKARLDPALLARTLQKGESVPYDKKSATQAIELFLKNHDDPEGFKKKLLETAKKNSAA